ncbi:MAG: hypothetical protein ABJB11_21560 [Ferruginibacter sp.]
MHRSTNPELQTQDSNQHFIIDDQRFDNSTDNGAAQPKEFVSLESQYLL